MKKLFIVLMFTLFSIVSYSQEKDSIIILINKNSQVLVDGVKTDLGDVHLTITKDAEIIIQKDKSTDTEDYKKLLKEISIGVIETKKGTEIKIRYTLDSISKTFIVLPDKNMN